MSILFLAVISVLLGGLNYYLYRKARRLLLRWTTRSRHPARWLFALRSGFVVMNGPYLALLVMWTAGLKLHQVPEWAVKLLFYPFFAWLAMLIAFILLAAPAELLSGVVHAVRKLAAVRRPLPEVNLARRNFLGTAAAVVPPVLFAIAARGVYGSDEIIVSPVIKIPVERLPRAFDGLTITHISDLHVGPYIRERELAHAVEVVNGIRSELLVITGDILDGSLDMLPTAQQALAKLRAPLGVYGILGNHDYYADRRLFPYPGCNRIMEGMREAGVRMLRDSRAAIALHGEQILVGGVDWFSPVRGNPNIYVPGAARQSLMRVFDGDETGAPRILLAHHPHVFYEASEFRLDLTLAGHTHGGGQVVIAEHNGRPIALGSAVFHWVSGHYTEGKKHLYVNRGLGFVGIPIRINCPAEISRFQLIRA